VGLSLIPLALFVISLLGRYFFVAEIISNFRCQIMFMLLPFVFLLFSIRIWGWGIVVTIATAWSMFGVVSVYLPAAQPPAGPQKIKIMSFNVLANNGLSQMVFERIREADPDVVTILEFNGSWQEKLQGLEKEYPYQILEPRWHGYGVAIFSRYALSNTRLHQLTADETDVPVLITDVSSGDTTIRLFAAHLFSPTNWQRLALRNRQLREIAKLVNTSRQPTIVMGDFNGAPWSVFLNDFLRTTGLRDSRQGFGFQASWHTAFPLLRVPIDQAFVSDEVCVHDRYVAERAGSDHFPVVFEVSVAQ
jgi:endonuclease/exonuclease/phosphatase (EEP) superfamily protein YafD